MITRASHSQSGFTLIEALTAMALMGLLVSALAMITAQWLPNWNRGLHRIQRSESVSVALDRIGADLAASEFIRPDAQSRSVLFEGSETSVTFVRIALAPKTGRGLDLVRIAETGDGDGAVVSRKRVAFAPGRSSGRDFGDPVVLLQAPYRVSFAFAGADRTWTTSWHDAERLPAAVRVTVRNAIDASAPPISRIAVIRVSAPADSVCRPADTTCDRQPPAAGGTVGRAAARSEP
ncbi:prepilin-type N-terminal cleavage/methylation domain-containing protein [Bradyrhizobium sp. STM 3809]|uniref:PulJ/GspJ family protein n=1 Tax=Bradyrhizobium sp. STM 3809 TaxID=551936 RepID=UPI0002409201|nr:prepilin-type N-terminal cleavage/methylation domain-containing protein [Bradyrhizobium sp. STM 3809]CCE00359.1 putative General secretion pathway protein J [Bradyrhizobium sp. STM 3809]